MRKPEKDFLKTLYNTHFLGHAVLILYLLCDVCVPVRAGRVQGRPRVCVLLVDPGPVGDQDSYNAEVAVQDGLVEGGHAWK